MAAGFRARTTGFFARTTGFFADATGFFADAARFFADATGFFADAARFFANAAGFFAVRAGLTFAAGRFAVLLVRTDLAAAVERPFDWDSGFGLAAVFVRGDVVIDVRCFDGLFRGAIISSSAKMYRTLILGAAVYGDGPGPARPRRGHTSS